MRPSLTFSAGGYTLRPLSQLGPTPRGEGLGGWGRRLLEELEALACRIHGEGDRPAGWMERKLWRECVDPRLSLVLLPDKAPANEAAALRKGVGLILVGRPASRRPAARTAGIGLTPEHRGEGLGRVLLDGAAAFARQDRLRRLETLAVSERVPWFLRCGYEAGPEERTLLAFGRGRLRQSADQTGLESRGGKDGGPTRAATADASASPDPSPEFRFHLLPELYSRSATDARWTVPLRHGSARISREGRAHLWHGMDRALSREALLEAAEELLDRSPEGTPVLAAALAPAAALSLDRAGWSEVQRARQLWRPL